MTLSADEFGQRAWRKSGENGQKPCDFTKATAATCTCCAKRVTHKATKCARSVMDDLREKYVGLIAQASDESTLEDLRVQAVGKKGEISLQMRSLGPSALRNLRQEACLALGLLCPISLSRLSDCWIGL